MSTAPLSDRRRVEFVLPPLLMHGFAEARRDASAEKQSDRLLRRLQVRGWHRAAGTRLIAIDEPKVVPMEACR